MHRVYRNMFLLIAFVPAVGLCTVVASGQEVVYPDTKRVDHFDDYHGTSVPDPYRWLEQDAHNSEEVAAWVEAQNEVTFGYLESIPQRDAIKQKLTEMWNYERPSAPWKVAGRYYASRNDGLQNHNVIYTMDTLDSEPRVLFDPNTWSEDGTVSLGGLSFSDDGRYVAYARAEGGSDWRTWHVRRIDTGADLPDTLRWVKFTSPAWTPDGRGFFYGRYDAPTGDQLQEINENQKLYYHRLGTDQSEDVLVFHKPDEPRWGFGPTVTEDGRYLVITVSKGTADKYRVMYRDLHEPYAMPVDLIDTFEAEYSFLGNDGPVFYFQTDLDAPRRRVIAIDTQRPDRESWREVVGEQEQTLRGVNLVGNMFVASYLEDARTMVRIYDMRGNHVRDVDLPGIGSASGFGGRRTDTETFYTFSSFAVPPSNYRYDLLTGEATLLSQHDVAVDSTMYETRQVFYHSKDGTRVPMFITHRKDLELNGDQPTLLYGYGGFNIPLTPGFSITRMAWMEMGGVYAVANLRGGGEYGEQWHQAGTRLNKQNVFDDFMAAAEWLIENDYTRPEKLAIQGGSNGGLLVGACMTQRPELFGACLPAVGVMDMLRFNKFTIGYAWEDDYGSPENPEEFKALHAYSPYHNIRSDTIYPPTLITTADHDDRVVPAHSFKYAAALQYAQSGDAPVLIRIETRAGHGGGKPTSMRIEEAADVYAFLAHTLGMSE